MEEILASIRRIISEDDEPNAAAAREEGAAAPAEQSAPSAPDPAAEAPAQPAPVAEPAAEAPPLEPEPVPDLAPVPDPEPIPEPEPAAAAPERPPMELPELPDLPPPDPPPMAAMARSAPEPESASDSDHILKLTDEIRPDGTVVNIETGLPVGANPANPAAEVVELELRDAAERTANIEAKAASAPEPVESPLVSSVTEQVAAETLASVRPTQEPYMPPPSSGMGGIGAQTIEQLVRDAVRPLIKEWLDANLPGMVERLVALEIARIGRRAEK